MTEAALATAAPPIPTMPAHVDLPLQHRHEVRLLGDSLGTGTVEVVWSTGPRSGTAIWTGKPYDEQLSLEPGHVDLSRLMNGCRLCAGRDRRRRAGLAHGRSWRPEPRPLQSGRDRPLGRFVGPDHPPRLGRLPGAPIASRRTPIRNLAGRRQQPVELSLVAVPADPMPG